MKELPGLCTVGAAHNSAVRFVNDDDVCFARTYDIVMANGSLHMLQDWKAMLARMARAATNILLINAVPLVEHASSFVILQRLRSRGFQNDFYSWAINRQELLDEAARHGLALEREVISWGPSPIGALPRTLGVVGPSSAGRRRGRDDEARSRRSRYRRLVPGIINPRNAV